MIALIDGLRILNYLVPCCFDKRFTGAWFGEPSQQDSIDRNTVVLTRTNFKKHHPLCKKRELNQDWGRVGDGPESLITTLLRPQRQEKLWSGDYANKGKALLKQNKTTTKRETENLESLNRLNCCFVTFTLYPVLQPRECTMKALMQINLMKNWRITFKKHLFAVLMF